MQLLPNDTRGLQAGEMFREEALALRLIQTMWKWFEVTPSDQRARFPECSLMVLICLW